MRLMVRECRTLCSQRLATGRFLLEVTQETSYGSVTKPFLVEYVVWSYFAAYAAALYIAFFMWSLFYSLYYNNHGSYVSFYCVSGCVSHFGQNFTLFTNSDAMFVQKGFKLIERNGSKTFWKLRDCLRFDDTKLTFRKFASDWLWYIGQMTTVSGQMTKMSVLSAVCNIHWIGRCALSTSRSCWATNYFCSFVVAVFTVQYKWSPAL